MSVTTLPAAAGRTALAARFDAVRARTLALAAPLSAEDQCVQSMPDASPVKWHLAHTTWFFEAVVLVPHMAGYRPFNDRYFYLFNSYYEVLGPRHARPQRGLLTRPSLNEVHAYRAHVDDAMRRFMDCAAGSAWVAAGPLVELGLHHEQQHQELILTDVLHAFWCNPLLPAYEPAGAPPLRLAETSRPADWVPVPGGMVTVGHGGDGFAFDNETPRHDVLLRPFQIADRLVTCGEYAQFVADGGYTRPALWLSDGWAAVQAQGWAAPAYWIAPGDRRAGRGDDVGVLNLFVHCLSPPSQLRRGLPVSSMCLMRAWVSGVLRSSRNCWRSTASSQASSTRLPYSTSPPHKATATARETR